MHIPRQKITVATWLLFPLLTGTLLYLFFSPTRRIFFSWLPEFPNTPLHTWLVYSLPDGLWAFSLALFLLMRVNERMKIIALIAVCVPESLQYFNILPGTFDVIDLFFSMAFGMTAVLIHRIFLRQTSLSRLFPKLAMAGALGVFLLLVMATSPEEPPPREALLTIENQTAEPAHIIVDGITAYGLDSSSIDPLSYVPVPDSAWVYVEMHYSPPEYWMTGGSYGYVRRRKVSKDSIQRWQTIYRLNKRAYTPYFDSLFQDSAYFTRYTRRDRFAASSVDCWVLPKHWRLKSESFKAVVPRIKNVNDTAAYPVYTITYKSNNGSSVTRRFRGGQFYRYADTMEMTLILK